MKQEERAERRSGGCRPLSSREPETVDLITVSGRQTISIVSCSISAKSKDKHSLGPGGLRCAIGLDAIAGPAWDGGGGLS